MLNKTLGTRLKVSAILLLNYCIGKGKDFAKLGILLGGTAYLSLADEPIRGIFQNQKSDFPRPFRDFRWYFVILKTILWSYLTLLFWTFYKK